MTREAPAFADKENLNDKRPGSQGNHTFVITPIFTGGIISNLSRVSGASAQQSASS